MKITTKQQLLEYIQKEAKRIVSENIGYEKEIENQLEMAVDTETGKITFNDLQDIANQYGLDVENEVLLGLYSKVSAKAMHQRKEELKDDIEYAFHEDFSGEIPSSFQEFYSIFKNLHFDNSYNTEEVREMYDKIVKDPAQLALFEDMTLGPNNHSYNFDNVGSNYTNEPNRSETHPFASDYDVLNQKLNRLQGEYMDLENLPDTDPVKMELQKQIEATETEIHKIERPDEIKETMEVTPTGELNDTTPVAEYKNF